LIRKRFEFLIESNKFIIKTLWDRYKALFALRNLNTDVATKKIAAGKINSKMNLICIFLGLFCEDSALFRHEVAYVLGQIQSPVAIDELKQRLCKPMENGMVRHECAEALGSIATEECLQILRQFLNDEEVNSN
jgi:deoxyhypusine monooxygenase